VAVFSPPALLEAQAQRAYVLLLFKIFLLIFVRPIISTSTDLHEICRIGRTLAVDERSGYFFDPPRDVAVTTNFVGKIDFLPSPCSSRDIR